MDMRLMLENGTVIDDPELGKDNEASKMCVECEDRPANRFCEDCDDAFCKPCFETAHAAGRRKLHTWTQVGPPLCVECEEEQSTRWCTSCDDPFCDACFDRIHKKGKKAQHQWNVIDRRGQITVPGGSAAAADYMDAPAGGGQGYATDEGYGSAYGADGYGTDGAQQGYGSDQGWYDDGSGYDQSGGYDESQAGYDQSQSYDDGQYASDYAEGEAYQTDDATGEWGYGTDGAGGGEEGEWQEMYDEESGAAYYVNSVTGETQWA